MAEVIDVADPADPRLDDFRDLNSVDRRPDLPSGKGLVIAEGVLVVQRMLASRFQARAMLGTDRRLGELETDLAGVDAPYYRVDADVMAEVVGFHLNRGVLASASRPPELSVAQVLDGARTVAVLEGVNDHENLGSIFRNAAGLGVDAMVFGVGCADPLYRRAVRVSMGHALLVPYAWTDGLADGLGAAARQRFSAAGHDARPVRPHIGRSDDGGGRRKGCDSRRRRGARVDRTRDAGERCAGADPDVARHRFAQRRDRRRPGVLRAG